VSSRDSAVTEIPNFVLNEPPHHLSWWNEDALRVLADRLDPLTEAIEAVSFSFDTISASRSTMRSASRSRSNSDLRRRAALLRAGPLPTRQRSLQRRKYAPSGRSSQRRAVVCD
jgi:hypothetical protein